MTNNLIFFQSPRVTIATNIFINVPTILQYEDTPLIEVVPVEKAGFTTQIPIYHTDGTYLAKVVGSRLFTTEDGKNAGLSLKYPKNKTVCELNGRTLFEIQREGATALKAWAELYTPEGAFVKCAPDIMPILSIDEKPIEVGGVLMSGCTFQDVRVGIWIGKDGSIKLGLN